MDNLSLETILNIIELCKYSEVDGEKAELIVAPYDNNGRSIRIGINGGFSREYFEYTYPDGNEFDKDILPVIVNHFLKDDKISSWVTKDPKIEDYPVKEVIVSEKGNEILIQTFDNNIHDYLKESTEKIQLNKEKVELTSDELAVEKILKYLKEKNKVRVELDKYEDKLKYELIQVIEKAYQINKGKTLTDEQIYIFTDKIHKGITKECYETIVSDIRNNNSRLINEIRDYLRNEHKYENYLDEEPYMSLKEVGEIISNNGYFELRYAFPQKTELYGLDGDKLQEIVTSRYKSKYKMLAELKMKYEQENTEESKKYASLINTYMGYLVKTTRAKINRKSNNKNKFKESVQNYKMDDFKTLMDAIKLYKGGKLDSEKLDIIVSENDDSYEVNVRLSNGIARDNNIFRFSKTDIFVSEVIPKLFEEVKQDDEYINKEEKGSKVLFTTGKGNELLVSEDMIKNMKIDIKGNKEDVSSMEELKEKTTEEEIDKIEDLESDSCYLSAYFRKLILMEKDMLQAAGITEIRDLAAKSKDVQKLEDARAKLEAGTYTQKSYDDLILHYRELLSKYVEEGLKRKPVKRKKPHREESEFAFLHGLLTKYKIQNVDGELRAFNREKNTNISFENPDDIAALEFASYWCSSVGLKSVKDDAILGETYAFSPDSKKLFDIIYKNFDGEKLNTIVIKEEFEQSGIEANDRIYNRLFKDQDHIDFVASSLKEFKRLFETRSLSTKEEDSDVKELLDEYKRIDALSDDITTANLVIKFLENDYVTVKTECEKDDDTKTTMFKKFRHNYFETVVFDPIIRTYIELDEIFQKKVINSKGSEKKNFIAIGKNSNVLQVRNVDEEVIDKINAIIEDYEKGISKKTYGSK